MLELRQNYTQSKWKLYTFYEKKTPIALNARSGIQSFEIVWNYQFGSLKSNHRICQI